MPRLGLMLAQICEVCEMPANDGRIRAQQTDIALFGVDQAYRQCPCGRLMTDAALTDEYKARWDERAREWRKDNGRCVACGVALLDRSQAETNPVDGGGLFPLPEGAPDHCDECSGP